MAKESRFPFACLRDYQHVVRWFVHVVRLLGQGAKLLIHGFSTLGDMIILLQFYLCTYLSFTVNYIRKHGSRN